MGKFVGAVSQTEEQPEVKFLSMFEEELKECVQARENGEKRRTQR